MRGIYYDRSPFCCHKVKSELQVFATHFQSLTIEKNTDPAVQKTIIKQSARTGRDANICTKPLACQFLIIRLLLPLKKKNI